MLWIQSANPIANMGQDAPRLWRAMKKVDFICVVDLFKTPYAVACADLLLPCAMSNERDCIRVWFDPMRSLTKCSSYFEAKEDEQIMIDLGHRLAPDLWPEWVKEPRDYMNWRMQLGNVGFTMEELEEKYHGMHYADFRYRKYEKGLLRPRRATRLHDADRPLRVSTSRCSTRGGPIRCRSTRNRPPAPFPRRGWQRNIRWCSRPASGPSSSSTPNGAKPTRRAANCIPCRTSTSIPKRPPSTAWRKASGRG